MKKQTYELIEVSGDWMPLSVDLKAWSTGKRWNGWAMPYFELPEALEALKWTNGWLRWYPERDCFEHEDEHDPESLVTYPGQFIEVDGRTIKVYQIGDGWCWDHGKTLIPKPVKHVMNASICEGIITLESGTQIDLTSIQEFLNDVFVGTGDNDAANHSNQLLKLTRQFQEADGSWRRATDEEIGT